MYGLYSYGLYSYGLYRYGLYSDRLYSYGLHWYSLNSHGRVMAACIVMAHTVVEMCGLGTAVAFIVMVYIVMACVVVAYMNMAHAVVDMCGSDKYCSCTKDENVLYSYGLYSYGLYSYGTKDENGHEHRRTAH